MFPHFVKKTISSSPFQHHPTLLNPLLRFSLSTQTNSQPQKEKEKELPFIAEYLISSFGFSPARALKYSNTSDLAAIRSPDRPEAVIKFLKDTGLSDAQTKAVVSFQPKLLARSVDKTLKPKVLELMENGFSGDLLVQLIRYNPSALYIKDTLSRLLFWKDFVGEGNQGLLEIIPKSPLLINFDIDKHIVPKMNLLKEHELSNHDIVSLLVDNNRCLTQSLDSLRHKLEIIEELGVLRGSTKFLGGLKAVGASNKDTMRRNIESLKKTYGWSQEEVHSAFRKYPKILSFSEDKLKSNMNFLIRKAGYEPRCIALQPQLLATSVERVLVPRYTVLSALEDKGLMKNCSLLTACKKSEERFREIYVDPFEKDLPGLGQAYVAAFGVRMEV
ncbi:Mitochondrial transcription termination factor-like [Rhynchospora pubera]|uniref:Mitochondrial transcription termination factor-like n=1 Tax=Rhynchospora pubera TaxID=906938 RepID=A0AAV8BN20_9POAL|nr:Mitochondrial transcription termination factor-like [Rhynchospora pubera]